MLVILVMNMSISTASAAENNTKKKALERKYGITIQVDNGFLGKEYPYELLEQTYSKFPEGLIKEITDFYKKKGINTVVRFQYKQTSLGGTFELGKKTAYISYYPNPLGFNFGEWTVAHEMGHYVHKYLETKYGSDKLRKEWTQFNQKYSYTGDNWRNPKGDYLKIFATNYGTKSYSEDFASVIEVLGGNSTALRNRLINEPNTPFSKKISYLNSLLVSQTKSVNSAANLWEKSLPQTLEPWAETDYKMALSKNLIPQTEQFNGLFKSSITRNDFCDLIANLIEVETGKTLSEFTKSKGKKNNWYSYGSISHDGVETVETNYPFADTSNYNIFDLNALGVINGKGKKQFAPDDQLTREQAAVILYNVATILGKNTDSQTANFADLNKINTSARPGVNFVATKKIMGGVGHNHFAPKAEYTYIQSYITLLRLSNLE